IKLSKQKQPINRQVEFESEKSETKQDTKNWHQKNNPPQNGKKRQAKKQQTKTTKHTIEFSNNTPGFQATLPLYSTWSERSNPVRQSIWTGALGFWINTTPYRSQFPNRVPGDYAIRSISAPRLVKFSTNSG
ncbi:hypothetical protein ACIA48_25910, partial [Mycobacterium sp. NPDC051804]|uniref:hypothetical protein n=1 Tax=Mycobacterium sp. NPDC051804 TaxID=3364295 RepID=UPI0037A2522D